MSQQTDNELITKTFISLIEETFEKVGGIYLDGGTSLMETLAKVSAAEASRPITEKGTSIASQVDHIRFYLSVLNDYIDGKWHDKVDWQESWKRKSVTDNEWNELRAQLKDDYVILLKHINSIGDWNDEKRLGGAMAIIVHTAYHLGAIRQIMGVVGN